MSEFVSLAFLEVFSYTGSTGGGLSMRMQGNMSFSGETYLMYSIVKDTYKFLRNKDSWVLALYNYIYKRIGSENMKYSFFIIRVRANINIQNISELIKEKQICHRKCLWNIESITL